MYLVNNEEMRALEQNVIMNIKIPAKVLMENAARSVVYEIYKYWPQFKEKIIKKVLILGGPGNNGGDGWAIARYLEPFGWQIEAKIIASKETVTGPAKLNLTILQNLNIEVEEIKAPFNLDFTKYDLIIDALYGTGLDRNLSTEMQDLIHSLNQKNNSTKVVSVDIPSGLCGDSGKIMGAAVKADLTICLAFPKQGLFFNNGPKFSGDLKWGDIGLSTTILGTHKPKAQVLTKNWLAQMLPLRPKDGHKGTFGHVVAVGGSAGKTGALVLTAQGALRGGAGLVTMAGAKSLMPAITSRLSEPLSCDLPESTLGQIAKEASAIILDLLYPNKILALGPGLGLGEDIKELVFKIISKTKNPIVLDADALSVLPGSLDILAKSKAPMVLTPHPGELARIFTVSVEEIQINRLKWAQKLAQKSLKTVVLKGQYSLIVNHDGQWAINVSGGQYLACGGTGDVLSGLIAALLAMGLNTFKAACLGVFVHGLAADYTAFEKGAWGLLASEIADKIPSIWTILKNHKPNPFDHDFLNKVTL